MDPQDDFVVEISDTLQRFFGCAGRMLKPSNTTVSSLLNEIPRARLITTDVLRKVLAQRHGVQVACPFDTKRALEAVARDPNRDGPYWRVVKRNGALIDWFPGGVDRQAALLREEGFVIDTEASSPRVKGFRRSLIDLC